MPKKEMPAEMPEMEPSSETTQCPECKTKKWPIILLSILVLALTVAIILMLLGVFGSTDEPTQEAVIDETENVVEETDEATEDAESSDAKTKTAEFFVNFDYIDGWHVYAWDEFEGNHLNRYIDAGPDPIFHCAACGGPRSFISFSIVEKDTVDFSSGLSYFELVKQEYLEQQPQLDPADLTELETQDLDSGAKMFATNVSDDYLGDYRYEVITFEGEERLVKIISYDMGGDARQTAGWEVIKNSLDFSDIE